MKIKTNKTHIILILGILTFSNTSYAQLPPNTYRTKSNPYYWKNRKPYEGYWQQDVHYIIEAEIIDTLNIIDGKKYTLIYWNNSPHALTDLYFHLHENAFQPGSHYHDLNINNKIEVQFGEYEKKRLGTVVENLRVNNKPVKTETDNTILRVLLNEKLFPGDSVIVTCSFKTYWDSGSMRRRNKMYETFGNKHFDGVHWYPIIAVYDMKCGWSVDQHLDKEFYANFGTFDVWLTFPQEYIVEATGVLINPSEVMPDSLRKALDLKNFEKKKWEEKPSTIIPRVPGKFKTWKFHAENVHNFAFTADPSYRIGERTWKGIKIITLAQEQHAARWQHSGWFTENVIRVYSQDFGMYAWPKIIIADARDGMEYPMLTLDNGQYPQHQSLLAHEVGHMWFYGMVGSNETYRAFLDEGFTQFLTVWSMDKILGPVRDRIGPNKYYDAFVDSFNTRYENLYYPYLNHVAEGYDEPLNTHSSAFNGAIRHGGNYGLVYYKTGVMLYNLRYVLGDSMFMGAMKHYFNKWKFCHPYPEDFRQAIIEYTQTDLNWFFDQWLETTKYIDYAIKKVKRDGDSTQITFVRNGRMQMPIDFVIRKKDNTVLKYSIPNSWYVKKESNLNILRPMWYGWDLLHPTYTTIIPVNKKEISSIEIDPEHILADIDLRDNIWKRKHFRTWQWDHRIPNLIRWDRQRNFWRPDIWYNHYDGLQVGMHAEGSYFGKHNYSATAWVNTTLLSKTPTATNEYKYTPLSFNIYYKNKFNKFWPQLSTYEECMFYGGIWKFLAGLEKVFRKQDLKNPRYTKTFAHIKYLANTTQVYDYLLYKNNWGTTDDKGILINSSFNTGVQRNYLYKKISGNFLFSLRTPFIRSDYNYSYLQCTNVSMYSWKKFDIRMRLFGQYGWGVIPVESVLYAHSANTEDLLENKYTRSSGLVPEAWVYDGTFHYGGGLNIRGYDFRTNYQFSDASGNITGSTNLPIGGNSGAALNVEIDFDRLIYVVPTKYFFKMFKIDSYLFSDVGFMEFRNVSKTYSKQLLYDAGIGTALTLRFPMYDIKPLVLRFDFPLLAGNNISQNNIFSYRYRVGLNRTF
ncbi:MAG: M1 family aminopeptidase [Cytophagaceae bacterium]|nr:M1 family aminopeptidase [Cytophagaceae bacterium]MDW8457325.1 M1 family aminopeptidase [Cytophagaceae bacterium]